MCYSVFKHLFQNFEGVYQVFKRESQNRPVVKKISELVNADSHKQKKYISLMIVPSYSGGKTCNLHIPQAVFYGIFCALFAVTAIIAGFYLRGVYFESRTHTLENSIAEALESFDEYKLTSEHTNIYLRDASIDMYEQLSNEQYRARADFLRQESRHQENFDGAQEHIEFLEQQIQSFEQQRLDMLAFLDERIRQIPPAANTIRELKASQASLADELKIYERRAVPPMFRLMAAGPSAATEAELISRLDYLTDKLNVQLQLIEDMEVYRLQIDDYLRNYPTLMPVVGMSITSGFGYRIDPFTRARAFHGGVDIPAATGTPILAAGGGVVTFSEPRNGYGKMIYIDHGDGISTRYAHNLENLVTVGQRVERGDVIAYVGSTGRTTTPHLHYEVLQNGTHVNPIPFITEHLS